MAKSRGMLPALLVSALLSSAGMPQGQTATVSVDPNGAARLTLPDLLRLTNRLAPRIRELNALRNSVVGRFDPDDLVLLGSQASRSQPAWLQRAS